MSDPEPRDAAAPRPPGFSFAGLFILLRSAGVGAGATLVDLLALTVLVSGFGVPASVASAPALLLGMATQFVGTKRFAFRDRSREWVRQGLAFAAVEALSLVANLALFELALRYTPVPYVLARLACTSLVYFAISLPLWSRVFSLDAAPSTEAA